MIRMIAAVSSNGVIGVGNKLPFHYPEDLKHFKECTINSTVIMGRKTFESIGKPLSKRKNVVITRNCYLTDVYPGVAVYNSLDVALNKCKDENIWLIGGSDIYQNGMEYADEIILTVTPDIISADEVTRFPWINPTKYQVTDCQDLCQNSLLKKVIYEKIKI